MSNVERLVDRLLNNLTSSRPQASTKSPRPRTRDQVAQLVSQLPPGAKNPIDLDSLTKICKTYAQAHARANNPVASTNAQARAETAAHELALCRIRLAKKVSAMEKQEACVSTCTYGLARLGGSDPDSLRSIKSERRTLESVVGEVEELRAEVGASTNEAGRAQAGVRFAEAEKKGSVEWVASWRALVLAMAQDADMATLDGMLGKMVLVTTCGVYE